MNDDNARKVVEQLIFTTNALRAQSDNTMRIADGLASVASRLNTQNQLLAELVKQGRSNASEQETDE